MLLQLDSHWIVFICPRSINQSIIHSISSRQGNWPPRALQTKNGLECLNSIDILIHPLCLLSFLFQELSQQEMSVSLFVHMFCLYFLTLSLWIILDESANRMHPLRGPLEASSVSTTFCLSFFGANLSSPSSIWVDFLLLPYISSSSSFLKRIPYI